MLQEFKAFIMRGNVVDLAVGVIIGAAFGAIVSVLVNDILMPPIGWAIGGVNFADLSVELPGKMPTPETKDKPAAEQVFVPVKIGYGKLIQRIIDFLIIGAVLFLIIKAMNTMTKKKAEAPAPAEPTPTEKLLTEIRDSLKK